MFYPIMLNIENKSVAIVGGGNVALRKAKKLLEYHAVVRVISPSFVEEFHELVNRIELISQPYHHQWIQDAYLVVAATSSKKVNEEISVFCRKNKILCNVADDINRSDFIVPSSIKRGSLVIAVSTSGKNPALAAKIRKEMEERYPEAYEAYVETLGDIRDLLLKECTDVKKRRQILDEIVNLNLEELMKWRAAYESSGRFEG